MGPQALPGRGAEVRGDQRVALERHGACSTALRDALHNLGFDCQTLDLDRSFVDGQQVDVDLEGGIPLTGYPGVDPLSKFYDANGDLLYNDGILNQPMEDAVMGSRVEHTRARRRLGNPLT